MNGHEFGVLLKAGLKRHKSGLLGIFVLIFLVSLSLGTVLTVWQNAQRHVTKELERVGYGQVTAWASGMDDSQVLADQIAALEEVSFVESQQVIFTNYEVDGQESDSEGQLIVYTPGRYRFFKDDLSGYQPEPAGIEPGTIYVSPSMISMFGVGLGDSIDFPIARAGGTAHYTVAGFYEDPIMGSSMIGMKGFLISQADYNEQAAVITNAGIDALGRTGVMLHMTGDGTLTASEFNSAINRGTDLPRYTEFVHSFEAIRGFMLILHNAFSGLLIAFVLVLLVTVFVALSHSIGSTIETDYVNMGILKTIGFTSGDLRRMQLMQYGAAIFPAMVLGIVLTPLVSSTVCNATLTTTGIIIPTGIPILSCTGAFLLVMLILTGFITLKTGKIGHITPMRAIRGEAAGPAKKVGKVPAIQGGRLTLSLALRQLLTAKGKYVSAFLVAVLLVFFASMIGRMDAWLGPDGKGMMDAFNPTDHDFGVQCFGTLTIEEAEKTVLKHAEITEYYVLAMQSVVVNGVDFTANVTDQPERFHIMEGRACTGDDEIVITEFIASDFGVDIGDTVTVSGGSNSDIYTITGIYSCANDMGDTVGLSREGYLKIGWDDPQIWCHHYFFSNPDVKTVIAQELEEAYGGDVHVHENTWPGLMGILTAMHALVAFMYVMVVAFILVVTVMTGSKILTAEQRDTGIYKAIGFSDSQLRASFALRFGMVALLGSIAGVLLAHLLTDPLVSSVMKLAGISSFASHPTWNSVFLSAGAVTLLFTVFAWFAAGKIKTTDLTLLIAE